MESRPYPTDEVPLSKDQSAKVEEGFIICKDVIISQSWRPLPRLMKHFLSLLGTEIV